MLIVASSQGCPPDSARQGFGLLTADSPVLEEMASRPVKTVWWSVHCYCGKTQDPVWPPLRRHRCQQCSMLHPFADRPLSGLSTIWNPRYCHSLFTNDLLATPHPLTAEGAGPGRIAECRVPGWQKVVECTVVEMDRSTRLSSGHS